MRYLPAPASIAKFVDEELRQIGGKTEMMCWRIGGVTFAMKSFPNLVYFFVAPHSLACPSFLSFFYGRRRLSNLFQYCHVTHTTTQYIDG